MSLRADTHVSISQRPRNSPARGDLQREDGHDPEVDRAEHEEHLVPELRLERRSHLRYHEVYDNIRGRGRRRNADSSLNNHWEALPVASP